MLSSTSAARQAIIDRFLEIIAEYTENAVAIGNLEERQKNLSTLLQDCERAGHLFGFDVAKEAFTSQSQENWNLSAPVKTISQKTIKEGILEEAEKAYPKPVRASQLRKVLERRRGETLHEKTIGMTLYRLSKQSLVRRDGWDWYFVPAQKNETPAAATTGVSYSRSDYSDPYTPNAIAAYRKEDLMDWQTTRLLSGNP
ncbi:hypothetical protein [Micavibrio aeruginosavorus]|uniref:hypothetical protein n=1 Tax=Micavibrio aeruginosavorus TaxID=349221 RepID=UPI003F4AEB3A